MINRHPYNRDFSQELSTSVEGVAVDRAFLAHINIPATVAASAVVKAASAATDILTIANTAAIGARANALSILLTTAADDNLAVTGSNVTGVITIALANATETKNTASLIQTAIRALTTVKNVNVASVTCTAGGNWDTAAKATGETAAVPLTGGISGSEAALTTGVHLAKTCTTPDVKASAVVKAASAETDILTTTAADYLGASVNALSILLTTAGDDNLAVTANDETGVITIALADSTASNNTAANIQAAIRALSEVAGVDVTEFTCAAGGNWDSAAIATGESAAVPFTGGVTALPDVLTTNITNPTIPRNITATAGGTSGDIKAVQVTITGTNYKDEVITEVLPIFTVDTPGSVTGAKAFKTVTQISIPAHDGTGATTAIGFGDVVGLPYLLAHNTVLRAYLNNTLEGTAPTVVTSATLIESNTFDLHSALDGNAVDLYLLV